MRQSPSLGPAEPPPPILTAHQVVKRFGGTTAVREVSFTLLPGSIHGLVGENGAGKSTFCKILAGVHLPDEGTLEVSAAPVRFRSPAAALEAGIGLIAQEVALAPARTVADNVFLGDERGSRGVVSRRAMRRETAALARELGFELDPAARVGRLPFSDQQKVEIMRAVARRSRVLIMDEPTAALGPQEAAGLFRVMRRLRDEGTSIIFISHHLREVLEVCDEVTIMRDGAVVRTARTATETETSLVTSMLGREAAEMFPPKAPPQGERRVVLSVRGMTGNGFTDVSFDLGAGEIVGLAGLVGAGRSEMARAVFGVDHGHGTVAVDGVTQHRRSAARSIRTGLGMIPESRRDQGLVMQLPAAQNIALAGFADHVRFGVVSRRSMQRASQDMVQRLDIRALDLRVPVGRMSGGNQQKTMFAKWVRMSPAVLIIDEPTRGVDIGAKQGIYRLIVSMARAGTGILLISSELDEVLGLAHRTLVMSRGRLVRELSGAQMTESNVMSAAFQVSEDETAS